MFWRSATTFERNLTRLGRELSEHNGPKVAVLGQPGAGKSTLLDRLTFGAAEPKPNIGTQTDATSWSANDVRVITRFGQYAYVDAPGYDTVEHPVDAFAAGFPFKEVDATIFVVNGKVHGADLRVFDRVLATGRPVCIARSHADSLDANEKLQVELDLREKLSCSGSSLIFFSNRNGRGFQPLREWIRAQAAG